MRTQPHQRPLHAQLRRRQRLGGERVVQRVIVRDQFQTIGVVDFALQVSGQRPLGPERPEERPVPVPDQAGALVGRPVRPVDVEILRAESQRAAEIILRQHEVIDVAGQHVGQHAVVDRALVDALEGQRVEPRERAGAVTLDIQVAPEHVRAIAGNAVVAQIVRRGRHVDVAAVMPVVVPDPVGVNEEVAFEAVEPLRRRRDPRAALGSRARIVGEPRLDPQDAVVEAATILAAQLRAGPGREQRHQRQVRRGTEHVIVGQGDERAEIVVVQRDVRDQEPALTFDRRVRHREVRHVEDRRAQYVHVHVAVFDPLVLQVLRRVVGAQLPQRPLPRILRAHVARRVDHPRQVVDLALVAARAVGRELAVLGQQRAHALDHAFLHAVRELGIVAEHHLPVRLHDRDMSVRRGHVGVAVERDPVGMQHVAVLPGLDVSARRDQAVVAVVADAVGLERHRCVAVAARLSGPRQLRKLRRGGRADGREQRDQQRPRRPGHAHQPSSR